MENVYERLIDLLGISPNAPDFDQFVRDFGEKPKLVIDHKSTREYAFESSGFWVRMELGQDQIKSVFFHLYTGMVESGWMTPYNGNLPSGIIATDDRSMVQKKLGKKPSSQRIQGCTKADPKDYWDHYLIGPLELTFIFDGVTKRFAALAVHYTEDRIPPEPPPPEPKTYLKARYTSEALHTIAQSHNEARRLKHNFIGSEFVLLALLQDPHSISAAALTSFGATLELARNEVENIIGYGDSRVGKNSPYTSGAKRALELAMKEAEKLGHDRVHNAHLLLGLIELGEGVACRVLENLNVGLEPLRNEVLRLVAKEDA